MAKTVEEAIDALYKLRKVTATVSYVGKTYRKVDGKMYNAAELIKLANSTDPGTWFR
jgi:hypothetical protein